MAVETPHSLLKRLRRQSERDEDAWSEFVALYTPWLEDWLRRHAHLYPHEEAAKDLIQKVLLVVCRRIGEFEHNKQQGAFRAWLRQIVINCLRDERSPLRGTGLDDMLAKLDDPRSLLSRKWDRDHDAYVVRRLLEMARAHFSDTHYQAFYQTKLEEKAAAEVAMQLNLSVAAVYKAASRVLAWLREHSQGLIDQPPA